MKKYLISFFAFSVLFGLNSCMDTKYVTKKATFDQTISQVRDELTRQGFNQTGFNTETKNDIVVVGTTQHEEDLVSTELKNNYVTRDTYLFTDAEGNRMSYTVSYQLKETRKGVPFVDCVEVVGCEVSSPADYDKMCGATSPINRFVTMKKDQRIKVLNGKKTIILTSGVTLVGLILLIASS